MCFDIKSKRVKIAKTDIECFKFLEPNNTPPFAGFAHRVYNPYIKGVVNPYIKLVIISDLEWQKSYINEGYHSYIRKEDCDAVDKKQGWGVITHKFIIPAGTRYYQNDTEYVSETIILID